MRPLVLCCNVSLSHKTVLDAACREAGYRIQVVAPRDFSHTIGEWVGDPPQTAMPWAATGFTSEMLVLCGIPDAELEPFLRGLRLLGVDIPRKAILTPTNRKWTFIGLARHLETEILEQEK